MSSNLHNRTNVVSEAIRAQTNEGKSLAAVGAYVDATLGSRGHVRGTIELSGVGVDGDTVTVFGVIYHLRNGTATPAGQVDVDITGGQTASETVTAIALAMNTQSGVAALEDTSDDTVSYTSLFELEHNATTLAASETLTNGTIEQTRSTASTWAEVFSATATAKDTEDDVLRFFLDNPITTVDHISCVIYPASGGDAAFLIPSGTSTSGRWVIIDFTDLELTAGARVVVVVHYS